ncbi:MAG TPA: phosphoribosyltransferase, partial [Candidatus Caldiarchaeum subterraneum]|nr:phosphoribosyltransferase [Candidatus Caldarchaeum subterraneum]
AIPRGGVVVGFEVARVLNCSLDVVVPRKIGAPYQPELAVGAVAEDGSLLIEEDIANLVGASRGYIAEAAEREVEEIKRRVAKYRGGNPPVDVKGKTVVIVDDGIATGATVRAAMKYVRKLGADRVLVAVPVAPPETVEKIKREADEVICLYTPSDFYAIGQFYDNFEQTTDDEVVKLLNLARREYNQDAG